jgi:murein DD-endopeptidase MepM/ murein hydrolase activator NlpD
VANGRHARGAEHPTALDPGPQAPETPGLDAGAPITVPAATGRRRRVIDEAPDTPAPSGRRRRAAEETPAEPVIPAPTGRRRRVDGSSEFAAESVAESVAQTVPAVPIGTGRRRRAPEALAAHQAPEPSPLVDAAPRAEEPTPAPAVVTTTAVKPAVVEVAASEATVVEIAPRSHRRAAPAKAAPAAKQAPAPTPIKHGHAGNRRKVIALPAGAPSGTALVAGAAAIAVAAAGAIGAASSGSNLSATNTSMSGASLLGTSTAAAPLVDSASVDREQARASRALAREALADRIAAAAALQDKQEAAARALAAAEARAQQLALLAQNYRLPVSGYHLTAGFGERSYHWSSVHTGLDFACAYGTAIHAVAAGQVIFAGWDGSYGWKTIIRHADGTETWYAHQSQILVNKGFVTAGQVIGRVGMTGNTTGPHLHLEVRINNIPVNPLTWLRAHGLRP